MTERLETVLFAGQAGRLEGLWKPGAELLRGTAVFAHPHPLFGGTLHSKVVFRAARALVAAGYSTLRFNFRGVGLSEGPHDDGRGETDDVRAAFDEAERRGGLPIVAGGFSFGSAATLRACANDSRIAAFLGVGLPLASESAFDLEKPRVPAVYVTGERDMYGPPDMLRDWVGKTGIAGEATGGSRIVIVPGADHFFTGHLDELETAVSTFLGDLAIPSGR